MILLFIRSENMVLGNNQITGNHNRFNIFIFPEKFKKLYEAQLKAKVKLVNALAAQIEILKQNTVKIKKGIKS